MIKLSKLAGLSLAVALFSGCNNEGIEIPDDHLISIERNLLIEENSEKEFPFKSLVDNPHLEVHSVKPSGAADIELNGDKVVITSHSLDRPGLVTASLYSGDGHLGDKTTKNFEVVVKNSSAIQLETEIESALKSESDLVYLKEDREIFEFFVDVAYINKLISYTEKENIISGFNPLNSPYHDQLVSDFLTLRFKYKQYMSAQISDNELETYLNNLNITLSNHSEYSKNKMLEIRDYYLPMISDFSNGSLVYRAKENRFSKYIGNPNLGSYSDDQWVFNSEYSILRNLVN